MNFLFPQGIGDAAWALLKIQDIAKKHKATSINIKVACFTKSEIEMRGFPFLERFSFVDSVSWFPMNRKDRPGPVIRKGFYIDALGRYVYIKSGPTKEFPGIDFVTIPNHDLERGIRLENWLPEYKINWNAIKDNFIFKNHEEDFAKIKIEANKKYCAFFMGNMASNSEYGHNRDSLWTIQDWIDLGNGLLNKNMVDEIIVVGATYDKDYYSLIGPQVNSHWHDFVGKLTVPECFAITKYVNFIISYQSGRKSVV